MTDQEIFAEKCINAIRFLSADTVEKANSGHPGMPLGAAAMAYTLFTRHLKHNPADPHWVNRDRFVLSAGHASALLYVLLHLTGYDLSLADLQSFRQWGSKTPGHPERHCAPGVEVTTGPLGQGISSAVGMAVAEAHLAARFNRPGHEIMDHFTYVMASDGDLMEGVAFEACALAGHLGLGKLIVLYDDNRVSLAGSTSLSFTEDVGKRFESCGWHVEHVANGNSVHSIDAAIRKGKAETARPSIICIRTIIGYGSPRKQGAHEAHGSPLGPEELAAAKRSLGWPTEPAFFSPDDVRAHFREALTYGQAWEDEWQQAYSRYASTWPDLAAELDRTMRGELPEDWESVLPSYTDASKDIATRKVSEAVMQAVAPKIPEFMGGSADLNPSTFTWLKGFGDFQRTGLPEEGVQGKVGGEWGYGGRNMHFGVREHAMAAIAGGMAVHGGIIPYTATFLTFSDYMRPSMRLAAMMGLRVIYVFTHDSIGLGEDGPTHQPVEHLMNLRIVPNMTVIRPADANETVAAWRVALLNRQGPTALIFSRQNLPVLSLTQLSPDDGLCRGGYILWESSGSRPDVMLIGTGSELQIALKAGKELVAGGFHVRVVSLPSWELFDRQSEEYREYVLPREVKVRIAIEAGIKTGWEHYVGLDGEVIGMGGFGASAPSPLLYEKFGITAEKAVLLAREMIRGR